MADDRIVRAIIEKCDFLYDKALLSKEKIIEKYLAFFAGQFDPTERSVSFAFHTGSLCFDAVSLAALMIGCLAYEFSSNDELLAELQLNDMVLFKGERYRWGGVEQVSLSADTPTTDYIVLHQDAKGKDGPLSNRIPYEVNKHLVKKYCGSATKTDGRGVRRDKTNRTDFISYILEIPSSDVPTALDLSVVVVADKNDYIEICNHLIIRYNGKKTVSLTDVVPVSYYTGNGEQFQIGKNPSKAESVIKITGNISVARDLVLDRSGNRIIGLMVTNIDSRSNGFAELHDLLNRKKLKFVFVVTPFDSETCEWAMAQYESAKFFACTKELLSDTHHIVNSSNGLTKELDRQLSNILTSKKHAVAVDGCWNWEQFRSIKEKLCAIKRSDWPEEDKKDFILSAIALINLFGTAFFSMERLENAIACGQINPAVVSPKARIDALRAIKFRTSSLSNQYEEIISALSEMYDVLYDSSPKEDALLQFLREHSNEKIAIIVPKAYYADIYANAYQTAFPNAVCISANRFNKYEAYDRVIAAGDIIGKRFDAVQCFAAPEIILLLYDFEKKAFSFRMKKAAKSERKLNARMKGLKGDEYLKAVAMPEKDDPDVTEKTMLEFSDLDAYVDSMGFFDIWRLAGGSNDGGDNNTTAEVKYVGTFTGGEKILFSKYYSAVVLDEGDVKEKKPEKLLPGDTLVFTKRNDYTCNIVDQIFDQLMRTEKVNTDVRNAAKKTVYWKAVLKEYKEKNSLTYRALAKQLKNKGCSLQEVTIRQWLIEASHVIGPQDPNTMKMIAEVTQDPNLLNDPNGYFDACRVVRHYRREILKLIGQAINDKLSNKQPSQDNMFEIVYENVDKLSEAMELEDIFELDDVAVINNGMVNRPISETEV